MLWRLVIPVFFLSLQQATTSISWTLECVVPPPNIFFPPWFYLAISSASSKTLLQYCHLQEVFLDARTQRKPHGALASPVYLYARSLMWFSALSQLAVTSVNQLTCFFWSLGYKLHEGGDHVCHVHQYIPSTQVDGLTQCLAYSRCSVEYLLKNTGSCYSPAHSSLTLYHLALRGLKKKKKRPYSDLQASFPDLLELMSLSSSAFFPSLTLHSSMFLTHAEQAPASGPLHLLCLPLEPSSSWIVDRPSLPSGTCSGLAL